MSKSYTSLEAKQAGAVYFLRFGVKSPVVGASGQDRRWLGQHKSVHESKLKESVGKRAPSKVGLSPSHSGSEVNPLRPGKVGGRTSLRHFDR